MIFGFSDWWNFLFTSLVNWRNERITLITTFSSNSIFCTLSRTKYQLQVHHFLTQSMHFCERYAHLVKILYRQEGVKKHANRSFFKQHFSAQVAIYSQNWLLWFFTTIFYSLMEFQKTSLSDLREKWEYNYGKHFF